jgi:UDP-glucuronate decarboxylase
MLLTASDKAKGEVVNVGNSKEVTVLELAKKIMELARSSSKLTFHPLPKDDPKRRCPDTSKIEELLGWKPKVDLEEGLKKTITWFSSKGYFPVESEVLSEINY